MKGRKELFEVLGIDLGFVANKLLHLEWYDIVHRAYCLGYVDRGEWHDTLKGAPTEEVFIIKLGKRV